MATDWGQLKTLEDWVSKLQELLDGARDAIEKNDGSQRRAVKNDLVSFVAKSPDWVVGSLDDIASAAVADLTKASIQEGLAGIESRTVELARHVKVIRTVTEKIDRDAKSIRLEKVRRVVEVASDTIAAMKELSDALGKSTSDKELKEKIETLIGSLQQVRAAVEMS